MHYTSGTTGKPKGVKRGRVDMDPDDLFSLYSLFLTLFGVQPHDGNVHITGSPLYHTAVLLWTSNSLHLGHKVVLMDKWDAEEMLALIDEHRVTTSHMVPTQLHRLLALPEEVRAKYDCSSTRCMVHAAAPCPPEVKRRMIEWWGDAIMEYYAATEGGGTIVTAKEWLERPGTVGKAWSGAEVRIYDDEGKQLGPGEIGTVYMALAQATFDYKGDEKKTKANRLDDPDGDGVLHRRRRRRDGRGRLPVPPRPQDRHDHQRRREHLPGRDRGRVPHPPARSATSPSSASPTPTGARRSRPSSSPPTASKPGPSSRRSCGRSPTEPGLVQAARIHRVHAEMPRDPSGKLYKRKLRDPYWEGVDRQI